MYNTIIVKNVKVNGIEYFVVMLNKKHDIEEFRQTLRAERKKVDLIEWDISKAFETLKSQRYDFTVTEVDEKIVI